MRVGTLRVLGIDPGLSACGVGVVDGPPHRPSAVRAGVIRTEPAASTAERLAALHTELRRVLAEVEPHVVAVEEVFFNSNVRTAMAVGQAAGIALLAAVQAGVRVVQYTPTQVKAAVTGNGGADKQQVAFMVRAMLRLAEPPRPADAADALALALCHLQHGAAAAHGADATTAATRLAAAVAAASPGAAVVQRGRRG